jgi:predicted secreted protein
MLKLKNRVFKAGFMTGIILCVFVTSMQTVYSENIYVFTIIDEQKNILEESPEEEWNETFGGTNFEEGRSVQQTDDGGYIITGYTNSYGAGGYDIWLIKADSNGTKEWDETFGGVEDDKAYSVQQTSDGGYIITGFTYSFGAGGYDVWLIKTDSNGAKEWDETFGGTNFDEGFCVQQTTDGGYIITGRTSSYGAGGHDIWLIKTDSNGIEEWNETYGGPLYDYGYSVQQTIDGGYIIAGFSGSGHFDVWLIKTDSNGLKKWDKIFGGIACDGAYSVQQTTDGGYILVGITSSYGAGGSDAWLIKTDSDGDKEWDEFFGGTDVDVGFSVQQTSDEGYIITGYIFTYSTQNYDAWLVKTDSDGYKEWDNTFGDTDVDAGNFGQQTADGGYIITGRTDSYGSGGQDIWLIRVESDNSPPYEPSVPIPENNSVNVDIDTNISWTGGDPEENIVTYDVYFGATSPPPLVSENQYSNVYVPGLLEYDTGYYWKIISTDEFGLLTEGPIWIFTTKLNYPPNPPVITGPINGKVGVEYEYIFVSMDSEGEDLEYEIRWGDGTMIGGLGPFPSGEEISVFHTFESEGTFTIKAKAKDIFNQESDWGELSVTIPRNKIVNRPILNLLQNFLQSHHNLFPILQKILQQLGFGL